jgi:hypothetical protein
MISALAAHSTANSSAAGNQRGFSRKKAWQAWRESKDKESVEKVWTPIIEEICFGTFHDFFI